MPTSLESSRPILANVSRRLCVSTTGFKHNLWLSRYLPGRSLCVSEPLRTFHLHSPLLCHTRTTSPNTTQHSTFHHTTPHHITFTMSSEAHAQTSPNAKNSQSSGNRASTRMSTYSATPTLTPSIAPSHLSQASSTSGDPKAHDIKSWNAGFERLEDKRLVQQRYALTSEKTDDMSKLALGAKLDRALGRRMSGQDAVFRPKTFSEKKVEA
jgi:hypothetical protein